MNAPDRPKRAYHSARRKEQALQTQRQVLEAARRLFTARGYSGAAIEAIAAEAGVAAETVYASFGSKKAILARLVDLAVGGDDQPIALLERPGPQAVRQERNPRVQIGLFAGQIAAILARVAPLFEVINAAAPQEPEIAALRSRLLAGRMEGMRFFIAALAANGPLRPGLSLETAAEAAWALSSAEVYLLLTRDRAWTEQQYTEWLAATLEGALLGAN